MKRRSSLLRRVTALFAVLLLFAAPLLAGCSKESNDISPLAENESYALAAKTGAVDNTTGDGAVYERKIVRTAYLSAQTKEYDKATAEIAALIAENGGFTASSSQNSEGDARVARMTVRVPADKLDAFLSGVDGKVLVTSSTVESNDISVQYYDTEARLATLRAEKAALDTMLENATTTAEVLAIHERLYDVMEEIDSLQTQMNIYADRVTYATVNITLQEVVEYDADNETFGSRAANAVRDSWRGFGRFWTAFALFLLAAVPTLLVLGVIAAAIIIPLRIRHKKKKPRAESDADWAKK